MNGSFAYFFGAYPYGYYKGCLSKLPARKLLYFGQGL